MKLPAPGFTITVPAASVKLKSAVTVKASIGRIDVVTRLLTIKMPFFIGSGIVSAVFGAKVIGVASLGSDKVALTLNVKETLGPFHIVAVTNPGAKAEKSTALIST